MSPTLVVPNQAPNTFFRTNQSRTDEQTALFGEITIDLSDSWSITGGLRYFENDSQLSGVVGWGPSVFDPGNPSARDTAVDATYSDSDTIYKLNVTWRMSDDVMFYATASEGYRPGGLNRDPGLAIVGAEGWV